MGYLNRQGSYEWAIIAWFSYVQSRRKTIAITGERGIALLESEAPADGYTSRGTGAIARKVVEKLHEEHGLYSKVIEKLKSDNALEEPVRNVALQIASARLWEDAEKQKDAEK